MRTRAQDVEAMALDVPYLSTTFAVAEPDIQSLIDAPTSELVKAFLESLTAKAHEFEQLKADKLKVDVELENTVRTSESKLKAQKATVTKHAKEIEELRTRANEAESARETVSAELDQLRSSNSGSSAETVSLRQRIETLETSNRDALALVESKSTEKDRVAAELSEQHAKLLGLRREITQLEERNQTLENAVSSQKFKEQSLQQEVDLLKRNNEWHTNELQTRNQEYTKFRKERNARISTLQRELEDSVANVDGLKRTEATLRQRLEEVQSKADDAFTRIATMQEDHTRQEQGWKSELEGSKRLADLQAQNAATHKARLKNIEEELEQLKVDAYEEVAQLQADIETERQSKVDSEGKVAELELKVEQLEQRSHASRPATPRHNGPFDHGTPGRIGSPFAFAASARKSGRPFTNTEYVSQINELQQDLEAERRRTQKLSAAMDEMIVDAETRGPELQELRDNQERLEEEVLNFSRWLEDSNTTRNDALKEAERWQADTESKAREGEILRQQLRDLSAQVKILLVEIQVRDQGLEAMSGAERFQLEQAARGESEAWSEDETMTNQFISQKLVIFRDVSQLQEQNQHLLQITRDLGERMEGEEARKKAAESEANAQEAEHLRQQVDRYKDELQATATQIDSYIKERDMFRRMLQHKGHLASDVDYEAMFGQSMQPGTPQRNGTEAVAQTPKSKDVEDMNKLLKEQQTFIDQYRNEAAQDRKTLKDQVDALGREKSTLLADVAHWKSQKTLAEERLQMVQANYNALRNENTELQKRSQAMAENAAKQDLRTQQVAEELVEARSMAESLRNENANSKAEKELWKRIETRLTDHNQELLDERSRLNKLVSDLQSLQNERELSDSENRRRLQGRVESLESELTETKKKLDQELDDSRRVSLRREYEEGQSRTRIDDLVKSLGNVREELVAAKTTRDQLQSRVDEMKIELRSAEEKVTALQPRPTPRNADSNGVQTNGEDGELSAEQRLTLELSEMRRDLELARNELESAKQQVEQYRAISQATEEELASFNETSEQYKEDVDRQIAEKDARASQLQQRVDDLSTELTTTNNELSELRTKHDDSSRTLEEQKSGFEAEITRLRDDAERHTEEKKLYQADLKAQAEIAQQAQQSYEDELLKHAEAAKSLQTVRREYNDLRTQVAGVRAEADAAKASLERSEESWTEQRDRFEKELEEAKRRRQDVDEQNRLLHAQMESFSSELAALRSGRSVTAAQGDERAATPSGEGNLQDVVKYLRREKEIVDVQYELSMQEAKRLQQQLDYANGQLEETRQKLAEERRQSSEQAASEGSTNKLMQTINELNLFRESSTTLRNEARQAREKLEEKSKEVDRLLAQIDPLKSRVGDLEGDLEGKDGEIKLLQDDRDHWRERTQNIISKYDRVDPAEIEEMKKRLEDLRTEKETLQAEQAPLREQLEGVDKRIEDAVEENAKTYRERLDKIREQAKEQNRKQVAKIKEAETAAQSATAEKTRLEAELGTLKKELDETKTALQDAQSRDSGDKAEGDEEGQVREQSETSDTLAAQLRAQISRAEKNATDQSNRAETLAGEVQTLQARVHELEGQVSSLQQQLDNALQGEEGEIHPSGSGDAESLDSLKQQLSAAQQEVETLRANASSITASGDHDMTAPSAVESQKSVAEQVAEEVAKLRTELLEQHELAKKQLEEERDRRLDNMRNQLRQKLIEERDKRQQLVQEHSAAIQKLRDEHEAVIAQLKEDHSAEVQRLTKEGGAAIAKAEGATTDVKSEQPSTNEQELPTEEQMLQLMKTNQRVKGIFNANINKRVVAETEKLQTAVKEKDEEIAKLREAANAATSDEEKDELRKLLAAAEEEKKDAVQKAVENETKKVRVQLSQRDIAQAKLAVVRKAAQETPDKAVKEVWEVADKAKPAPKPAAAAAAPVSASPAAAPAKPAVPPSPTQAQPSSPAATPQAEELTEEEKLRQRQQRFGTTAAQPPTQTGTFGQPSVAPASGIRPPSSSSGSFGQPSQVAQPGSLAQPARRPSTSGPNPQAAAFTPSSGGDSSVPQLNRRASQQALGRGGLPQPRGGAAPRGDPGLSIQGAASANAPAANAAARGGVQSGIPRGGVNAGRGRGGIPRGGAPSQGQKRQHEGGDGGNDSKRTRGGGPGGA